MISTQLYLIRHGIAVDRHPQQEDIQRPLTAKGRDRTTQVAQRLKGLGLHFDTLLSSPLVRAYETAEILVFQGLAPYYTRHDALAPEGHLSTWLPWLEAWQAQHPQGSLALVGHEPDLTQWAQRLVSGAWARGPESPPETWQLKKAGVIGLHLPAAATALGGSTLFWLTPPRLLL